MFLVVSPVSGSLSLKCTTIAGLSPYFSSHIVDVVTVVQHGRISSPRIRFTKLLLPEDVSPAKTPKRPVRPVRYPVNWMAFYATQNGTILLEAFSRTAASRPYRIYSIKRCPRSNAADGRKITNKRRPRINRPPNENKKNLGTTCSLCTDVPLLPIFSDGVGGVCTQAIQLGNFHDSDIYDFYLSEIRETLEPLNYIIFTNDLPPLIKRHS